MYSCLIVKELSEFGSPFLCRLSLCWLFADLPALPRVQERAPWPGEERRRLFSCQRPAAEEMASASFALRVRVLGP